MSLDDRVDVEGVALFVSLQVKGLRQLLTVDSAGPVSLNQALLELPASLRQPMVKAVLQGSKPTKAVSAFAAVAMLFPFDAGTKRLALDWLVAHGGSEVRAYLATLPDTAVDAETFAQARRALMRLGPADTDKAKAIPGVPLQWPVVEAFATTIDGQGSQGLYLTRRISPRKVAMVGAVCDDHRGIADGIHMVEASSNPVREMMMQMALQGPVEAVPVPPGYVVQRIQAGVEWAETLHLPLPHEFQVGRYLLAGLDATGAPDVMALVKQWAEPKTLPDTHYLLHTTAGAAWYYGEEDGLSPTYLAAADKALKKVPLKKGSLQVPLEIAREADDPDGLLLWLQRQGYFADLMAGEIERVFTAAERWRWYHRLSETAYWFDRAGRPTMRGLAATAAQAIEPGSGIPLKDHPLVSAILSLSVLHRYE